MWVFWAVCVWGGDLGEHPSEGQGLTPMGGVGWVVAGFSSLLGGNSVDSRAQACGGGGLGGVGMAQLC